MLLSNCHTHTDYCDGKSSAEQMIISAIKNGLISIGISSHSPMTGGCNWTMKVEDVKSYINEINALKEKYKDKIQVYCGIELDNNFTGINLADFDYSIGSVHQFRKDGNIYDVDYSAEMLSDLTNEHFSGDWNKMADWYFNTLADFVIGNDVDVVGHFDLITKFNEKSNLFSVDEEKYKICAIKALNRILQSKKDIIFEVNTGAMSRCGNKIPYPSYFILEHLFKCDAHITITGDSHSTDTIIYGYETAIELCKECGFTKAYFLLDGCFKATQL